MRETHIFLPLLDEMGVLARRDGSRVNTRNFFTTRENKRENKSIQTPRILKPLWHLGLQRWEEYILRNRLKSSIHVLENSETGIVFVKEDISVLTCPHPLKNSLGEFLEGYPVRTACGRNGISIDALNDLLLILLKKTESKPTPAADARQEKILNRLVLNVSHACNLRCRYCYAGGGNYGGSQSLMDRKTALAVLDTFFRLFDRVENIQFFGGEPFLNTAIIRFVCSELQKRYQNHEFYELPHFGVVTNGTVLTPEIIKLLQDFQFGVTISVDGPEGVHDYLRGKGTYKRILRFIRALRKAGLDFGFESTFTSRHLELGVGLNELMDFFTDEFDLSEVHIPPVALSGEDPLALDHDTEKDIYRAAVEYSTDNLLKGKSACLSFAARLMRAYTGEKPVAYYCPAGFSTLSVDPEGNVFPCFMLTGIEDFTLGNVFDPEFPDPEKSGPITERLLANEKHNDPECLQCWASPFCSGCIGADYIKNGRTLTKTKCDVVKSMIEGFLSKIVCFQDRGHEKLAFGTHEKGGGLSRDIGC